MKNKKISNTIVQLALPALTISAQIATAMKYPEWGLILNLISQPFWLYSSWKSYKKAGQYGILLTSIIFTIVTLIGIVNYWVL